jgi:TonB family protein
MIIKNHFVNIAKLKALFIVPVAIVIVIFFSCNKNQTDNNSKAPVVANKNPITNQKLPEFPGGSAALTDFILKNVQYPESAKKAGKQGQVSVSFTIDKTGKVKDATIESSICPELDKEALRVVKQMPAWKPGQPSDVKMTLPINFKLADNSPPQFMMIC